jgi:hypothetical protein
MTPAETKDCISNISPKLLILQDICFNKRKLELAEESYNKATLNNDYGDLNKSNEEILYRMGRVFAFKEALRYVLAQEAEASGRKVSADMREFDSVVEEMVNGAQ